MKNKFINSTQFSQVAKKVSFLYKNLWKEFTTCLLHGARQTDKSESAIDIAVAISSDERDVIFINTESHAEDYSDKIATAPNLYIFTPEFESPNDPTDYADLVIAGIEEAVKTTEVRTFVIDSVTRIAALSFGRNASAAYVMKRLVALQVRYKLSLLIVAHDSTKSTDRALLNLAHSEIILAPEPDDAKPIS
ncbi:MAG: AAA family ATPase, partial [Muribaculaceae bacterium]|nr:AAA family ATPase [Muribaculaceae bacterium]